MTVDQSKGPGSLHFQTQISPNLAPGLSMKRELEIFPMTLSFRLDTH